MKTLFLSIAFISTSLLSVTSNNDVALENFNEIHDDALYCSASGTTTTGQTVTVTCWLCDCKENIKALQGLLK